MANITDLIEFIEGSPLGGDAYWYHSRWKTELSEAVPNWRRIVANPQNWDVIEGVTPLKSADELFRTFVGVGGPELAKRWFHSDVSDQRNAVRDWLTLDASVDISLWQTCDRDMKNTLLEHTFKRHPGEPFEMLKYYNHELRRIVSDIDHADLRHAMLLLPPHIIGYVPSQQIEKLRSTIEDADDQVYLRRIDEMISRREEACKVASFQQQHRMPYTPNSNEKELIARLIEITRDSGYLPEALPPIFISSETPPLFIAYPELEEEDDEYQIRRNRERRRNDDQIRRNRERRRPETISIEEFLGVYQSQHQQIIIYERGIRWRRHQYDEEWLRSVVLIHEIGHWITHVLPKSGVPTWPTNLFALSERDLKEGWAQLITWWIAEQVGGRFKDTFEKLNQGQSAPYHVFERFKNEPVDKVMASLERLRLLPWPARLQDWREALRM